MNQKTLQYRGSVKTVSRELDPLVTKKNVHQESYLDLNDLKISSDSIIFTNSKSKDCINCMGRTLLCGKRVCPIIEQFSHMKHIEKTFSSMNLIGSSPPSVFIGRNGYPKVSVGPMVPPITGDTVLMDETELWWSMDLDNILNLRMNLVRCKSQLDIHSPSLSNSNSSSDKILDVIQQIGLADKSIEMEVKFSKPPKKNILLDADIQPMGPSAPFKNVQITSNSSNQLIQKTFDDTDLKAQEAILKLKSSQTTQSSITRAFSSGLMGIGKNRKLIPTRWAITAVDSTLGIHYWKNILHYPLINEFRVYESNYLDNKFLILMIPDSWGYELIEAFFPGSCWNPGLKIAMANDWEGLKGRKTYASIGGCYYAARNMVGEALFTERRQARVTIFRETYPDFVMPLGVWFTRECVRNALQSPYLKFDNIRDVLHYVNSRTKIPTKYWIETSGILKKSNALKQKSVYKYIS